MFYSKGYDDYPPDFDDFDDWGQPYDVEYEEYDFLDPWSDPDFIEALSTASF